MIFTIGIELYKPTNTPELTIKRSRRRPPALGWRWVTYAVILALFASDEKLNIILTVRANCAYAANNLTSETSVSSSGDGQFTATYSYDVVGNRLKKTQVVGTNTTTIDSTFNANDQLLSEVTKLNASATGTNNYGYDSNGSMTSKTNGATVTTYGYNLQNKLASMASSGVTNTFQYNDQGIRVRSTVGGNPKYYLIDANNHTGYQQVIEEFTTLGGTPAMSYVIGDDVLAQATSTASYFLYDGHGSTRQLATAGSMTSRYNYDAYGQMLGSSSSGTPPTSLLYCGEQYDSTLNMYNLRARFYDPANGRFNQRDRFSGNMDPQSLHKYAYANLDPINGKDPSGYFTLVELLIDVAIMCCLGAAAGVVVNGVNNYATGKRFFDNAGKAAKFGAIALPLCYMFPILGIVLAGLGFAGAVGTAYQVFTNPNASASQAGASLLLVGLSVVGGFTSVRNAQNNGFWFNAKYFNSLKGIICRQPTARQMPTFTLAKCGSILK